jgi:hypothetical protein
MNRSYPPARISISAAPVSRFQQVEDVMESLS